VKRGTRDGNGRGMEKERGGKKSEREGGEGREEREGEKEKGKGRWKGKKWGEEGGRVKLLKWRRGREVRNNMHKSRPAKSTGPKKTALHTVLQKGISQGPRFGPVNIRTGDTSD
jgi:hypothetical protein